VFEWLSDNRASVAAILIILILIAFVVSIFIGTRQAKLHGKDEVFGDPLRTRGGWYWAVCGVCAILLTWFYFSWGVGRAYFPDAANEMCQVAKLEEAISPITARLPIESRYYKSTLLVSRNTEQLTKLEASLPVDAFSAEEQSELKALIAQSQQLIVNSSNPDLLNQEAQSKLVTLSSELNALSDRLRQGSDNLEPTAEALAQPKWGVTHTEIPILPTTSRGVLFDEVAKQSESITATFVKVRNKIPANDSLIADTKARIILPLQILTMQKMMHAVA